MRMTSELEISYIAVSPPDHIDADLIKKVAHILNKENYDTRRLLVGRIPRIIARYNNLQEAESAAQGLKELGLVVLLCRDSELRRPAECLTAFTMEFGDGEVLFKDKPGNSLSLEAKDVSLIIKGIIRTQTMKETTSTKLKLSLPATLVAGGLPVWRPTTQKSTDQPIESTVLARIYSHTSLNPKVELFETQLDYSFLGSDMTSFSPSNFTTVITKLRKAFPKAIFDDRFMKPIQADVPSSGPEEDLDINCKLLYLYYEAIGTSPSQKSQKKDRRPKTNQRNR